MALTLESLLVEVGGALAPLGRSLRAGQASIFFAQLGLPARDSVLAVGRVESALEVTADALDRLPDVLSDLTAAIASGGGPAIVEATGRAIPIVRSVTAAIGTLAAEVEAAASAAGADAGEVTSFAPELAERLFGFAVASHIERSRPALGQILRLLGIIEVSQHAATPGAPAHVRRIFHFDRIAPLLEDPVGVLAAVHRWGTVSFDWDELLVRLYTLLDRVSNFAFVQPGPPPFLRIAVVDIEPTNDEIPGLRASVRQEFAESLDATLPVRPGLDVEIAVASAIEAGAAIEVHPPARVEIEPPTTEVSGQARIGIAVTGTPDGPVQLLGIAGGTQLEAGKVRVSVGADLSWDLADRRAKGALVIEGAIEDGRLLIGLGGADGFLSSILPAGGLSVAFDVLAGWSADTGLHFDGSAGLAIDIPVDLDLGSVRIQMLHLRLDAANEAVALEASGAISARVGPFAMAVDRMGTRARVTFDQPDGNLGPANLAFEFKPPSGIGLSLDAGIVKGGGYLYIDPARGEYAGILELALGPVSVKAIGILTTKLPGNANGWALLLMVFGEFQAIQLGYGFTLTGVGGIIGLQHGVSVAALQDGLRTGVLDSVLFPRDPVANAPALISQLRVVYPIVPRALILGPALKIGWSTPALVTLRLGLVLQFDDVLGSGPGQPALSRIVLVGQLKVQIPPVDELGMDAPALLQMHVDIVGAYDLREQALAIDAVLRDSHVALLPITGSLVVRARFGADPSFLLAVGGFHPRFTDVPPGIPPQTRVGIQLEYGIAKIRLVGYFAITSNTVQIGAEASIVAAGGGFRVTAQVGFDALFVFDPVFRFEIDFRVGAAIRYKSLSLTSVRLDGRLTGPGRWEIRGSATIELLFFDVGIDFNVGWGDAPTLAPTSVKVGTLVAEALRRPGAWTAQLPDGGAALVSLRRVASGTDVLAHPLGEIAGIQKVVPLGIRIDRVGRARPSDGHTFTITRLEIGDDEYPVVLRDEHFARGEFLDLTEEQKLSRPSFERFPAGVVASTNTYEVPATQIDFEPVWETFFLGQTRPAERHLVDPLLLVKLCAFGAVARSQLRDADRLAPAITSEIRVSAPSYTLTTAGAPSAPVSGGVGMTFTEASQIADATVLVTDLAEVVAVR